MLVKADLSMTAMKSHGVVGGGVCGQEVVVRGRAEKKGIRGR